MKSPLLHTLEQASALRRKWASGQEPSFLGWITSDDPAIAEMEVEWGYDGLIIDTEHATFDVSALRSTLMAFRGTDCVPLVRVGDNNIHQIKLALDLGAGGVLIPLLQNAEAARAAVQFCRYPPNGGRGVAPRRAGNYFRDAAAYLSEANRALLLMAQIESVEAYQNLDAILEVEGIDCLLVGLVDLSASMGHMWQPMHPEVVEVTEDILRRSRQAGRSAAVAAMTEVDQIKHWLDAGANVIATGADTFFMEMGFQAFKAKMQAQGLPFALQGQ